MKTSAGFTLIEIMLVVSIIAVIVAIAIPQLVRSRAGANESNAICALRTISQGQTSFRDNYRRYGQLGELDDDDPPYVDGELADGEKQGYIFATPVVGQFEYQCIATPIIPGKTGTRSFCVDESAAIYEGPCGTGTPIE